MVSAGELMYWLASRSMDILYSFVSIQIDKSRVLQGTEV